MKFLLLPLLVALCGLDVSAQAPKIVPPIEPGVSHDLAAWRAAHYADIRYKLNLTLEKMSPVLKGTIEIRVNIGTRTLLSASPASAGELPPIILDWRRIAGHETDHTINNVSINGTELQFSANAAQMELTPKGLPKYCTEENEHLVIRDGIVFGENVIKLDFTSPILTSGSGVTRQIDKDGSESISAHFGPGDASTAFPVFDQPDMRGKFGLTVSINGRSRPDWVVVSNTKGGAEYSSTWNTLWQFEETQPISIYDFQFKAGAKK